MFPDDFKGDRSLLTGLNLVNIKSEIWRHGLCISIPAFCIVFNHSVGSRFNLSI